MGFRPAMSKPSSQPPRAGSRATRESVGAPLSRLGAAALPLLALAFAMTAGCGSSARTYAQEARSSYVSARAVLVGVEEFPSGMEGILRSGAIGNVADDAAALIADARGLLPTASSAFRAAREKAELLKGEDSEKFTPYADMLLELTALGEQLINAYTEFIGLSGSVLEGLPYGEDPQSLMPTLGYMDEVASRIRELNETVKALEEETEALYQEIMGSGSKT